MKKYFVVDNIANMELIQNTYLFKMPTYHGSKSRSNSAHWDASVTAAWIGLGRYTQTLYRKLKKFWKHHYKS